MLNFQFHMKEKLHIFNQTYHKIEVTWCIELDICRNEIKLVKKIRKENMLCLVWCGILEGRRIQSKILHPKFELNCRNITAKRWMNEELAACRQICSSSFQLNYLSSCYSILSALPVPCRKHMARWLLTTGNETYI